MKKIYRQPHSPFENILLIASLFGLLAYLRRTLCTTTTILGSYGPLFFWGVAALMVTALLALILLNSGRFYLKAIVSINQKVTQTSFKETFFYVITADPAKIEVTHEMFDAVQEGDTVQISLNSFTKKVETLEIL